MKQNNIEKSSAELLEYIENLIVDVPALSDFEINEGIKKILDKVNQEECRESQNHIP